MPPRGPDFPPEPFDEGLALELAERVHEKYNPVFDALERRDRAAVAWYFLPHRSGRKVLLPTRPRMCGWYCPFADDLLVGPFLELCVMGLPGAVGDPRRALSDPRRANYVLMYTVHGNACTLSSSDTAAPSAPA